MVRVKMIKNLSPGTWAIVSRKVPDYTIKQQIADGCFSALGLCQGTVADIIEASDLAEKSAQIQVAEITGNCPQHITCIGVFGDISAVESALNAIRQKGTDNQ